MKNESGLFKYYLIYSFVLLIIFYIKMCTSAKNHKKKHMHAREKMCTGMFPNTKENLESQYSEILSHFSNSKLPLIAFMCIHEVLMHFFDTNIAIKRYDKCWMAYASN